MPPPTEPLEVAAVILAAGASRRMGPGRNKMLLRLEGESLVHRAARRAAGAGLAPVVVVLGAEAERVRAELADLPCDLALNPDFTGPTSGSLHRGLERIPPTWCSSRSRCSLRSSPPPAAATRPSSCPATERSRRRPCCFAGRCSASSSRGRAKGAARRWSSATVGRRRSWIGRTRR
ncbi:MAG: hypothetical protein DMD36_12870 [Gemmatimonadetes bacterium]|nr:MAG: hypothetical protein DMD36_12870 [Gemmatimonadota bacterium]